MTQNKAIYAKNIPPLLVGIIAIFVPKPKQRGYLSTEVLRADILEDDGAGRQLGDSASHLFAVASLRK
jgi:hypothetical protein